MFFNGIKNIGGVGFEIKIYGNNEFKAITIDLVQSETRIKQKIVIPGIAVGFIDYMGEHHINKLLKGLEIRNDCKVFLNMAKFLGENKTRENEKGLKTKKTIEILTKCDQASSKIKKKETIEIKNQKIEKIKKAVCIRKDKYCISAKLFEQTAFINLFVFFNQRNYQKSFDILHFLESLSPKDTTPPSYKFRFLSHFFKEILTSSTFTFKNHQLLDNFLENLTSHYVLHFKLFKSALIIQSFFRKYLFKRLISFQNTKHYLFYHKILRKIDFFWLSFFYTSNTPYFIISISNITWKSIPKTYFLIDLSKFSGLVVKSPKPTKYFSTLAVNILENQLNIEFSNNKLILSSKNPELVPILAIQNLTIPIKNKTIQNKRTQSIISEKTKDIFNESASKITRFFIKIHLRRQFLLYKTLHLGKTPFFLRSFLLRHFSSLIAIYVFFQVKSIVLLNILNLSCENPTSSKYYLSIEKHEIFEEIRNLPPHQMKKRFLEKKIDQFLRNTLVKNLRFELIFEYVQANLIYPGLKLIPIRNFKDTQTVMSSYNRYLYRLTTTIIIMQGRFRSMQRKRRCELALECERLKQKTEVLILVRVVKLEETYCRIFIYRLGHNNHFRVFAKDVASPKETLFNKIIEFDSNLFNLRGRTLAKFIVEAINTDNEGSISVIPKSQFEELSSLKAKTEGFEHFVILRPSLRKSQVKKPIGYEWILQEQRRYQVPELIYHVEDSTRRVECIHQKCYEQPMIKSHKCRNDDMFEIQLDLESFAFYNPGFEMNNPDSIKKLIKEIASSVKIESGKVLVDANKVNPACLELIERNSEIQQNQLNHKVRFQFESPKLERANYKPRFSDFGVPIMETQRKLYRTLKMTTTGRKVLVWGISHEDKLKRVPNGFAKDETFEEYEISFEIISNDFNAQTRLKMELSCWEATLITSGRTFKDHAEMLKEIIGNLKISEEYFIYLLETNTEHMKGILKISRKNGNCVIFMRKSTLQRIYTKARRMRERKQFQKYKATLERCWRVYAKIVCSISNQIMFLILAEREHSKLEIILYGVGWNYIGQTSLSEEFGKFLLNPMKWRRVAKKIVGTVGILKGKIVVKELELWKELMKDRCRDIIEGIERKNEGFY